MDVYYSVESEILYITTCDENSYLGTLYLGKEKIKMLDNLKAEEIYPLKEQEYAAEKG